MRKIIAVGGGEIGRSGYPVETTPIDQQIVALTGKSKPQVLFIPTASGDADGYIDTFKNHFGNELGCRTDALCLIKQKLTIDAIQNKILGADAIYVGGGNTAKMLRIWRKLGVDLMLKEACERGIVLSGLSAGAICWFRYGSSDSRKFNHPDAALMRVSGLNFIPALVSPHYDAEADRRAGLQKMMRRTPGVALALDNCSAVEIIENEYRIITSKPNANAYRVFWSSGVFHEEKLPKNQCYQPLTQLLQKR